MGTTVSPLNLADMCIIAKHREFNSSESNWISSFNENGEAYFKDLPSDTYFLSISIPPLDLQQKKAEFIQSLKTAFDV